MTCQAPLSMRFSRQEYWSGLPFPTPDPGIESASLMSPASHMPAALAADSLPLVPPRKSMNWDGGIVCSL